MYFQGQSPAITAVSLVTSITNFMAYFPTTSLITTEYGASTDWYGDEKQQAEAVGAQAAGIVQMLVKYPR